MSASSKRISRSGTDLAGPGACEEEEGKEKTREEQLYQVPTNLQAFEAACI